MVGRNMNVYFQEETYNKIKGLIARREISRFINEAVEEKLQKKTRSEQEELHKKLIAGYQGRAKKEKLKKTLRVYGEMSWEDISTELSRRERKNGQK